jgi:hypothetical protein
MNTNDPTKGEYSKLHGCEDEPANAPVAEQARQ